MQLEGRTDAPRAAKPKWASTSLQASGVVLLPMIPGARAEEETIKPAALEWRYHTAKASCRTGQGVSSMTPLVFGVLKGRARKSHQQREEPGKQGAPLSLWGPALEASLQGNPGLGLDVQARL